mmetsp:Transcript_13523/g.15483  ORF Transcript_13523/g.15483 Transcript_13523/m.15483 type:complete len:250 (+) Transcript_13523:31-780(+)
MDKQKAEHLYMARLAEQTERYEDMVDHMKKYISIVKELQDDERNLLSLAYKNTVTTRRTAWRAISALENKERTKNTRQADIIKYYKNKIEKELEFFSKDCLDLVDDLLANATSTESRVFYLKMQGDYNRYLAEFLQGDRFNEVSEQALKQYKEAMAVADAKDRGLKTTDVIKLGLALNYSVFYYEIRNDANEAVNIARKAFDDAIADLESLEEEKYKDSTTIMQLLRDNITLWTNDLPENNEQNQAAKK